VSQAHDSEHEDDSGRDKNGLDDSRVDVADREGLVLTPCDRVEGDGRSDVRDDEKELQERSQIDLVVLPLTCMYPAGSSSYGLEQQNRTDRRNEREDEQKAEDPAVPLVVSHAESPSSSIALG
jgi:hypothetical protein